nr:hypothetical protein [Tanacetum cinerariifolium]
MFRVNDLDGDKVVVNALAGEKEKQNDDLTLAKTLIEIKAAKPKAATTVTTVTMIAEWDNTHAIMDADYKLAAKLQEEERGELSIEKKSKLFIELMNKRKKHFEMLRSEERRRKSPTKE